VSIIVKPLQQPTPRTCTHTCLAMVTGESIESLIERFGDRGLGFAEEACVLIEHGIFPVNATGSPHEFAFEGVYLVSTPSLNLPGKLHMVVVEASPEGYVVHDPNTGLEGVKAYHRDAIMEGELARCEVRYLDHRLLTDIKGPEVAELAVLKRKLAAAEAEVAEHKQHMEGLTTMRKALDRAIERDTARDIRRRLANHLDEELDAHTLGMLDDIVGELDKAGGKALREIA